MVVASAAAAGAGFWLVIWGFVAAAGPEAGVSIFEGSVDVAAAEEQSEHGYDGCP